VEAMTSETRLLHTIDAIETNPTNLMLTLSSVQARFVVQVMTNQRIE